MMCKSFVVAVVLMSSLAVVPSASACMGMFGNLRSSTPAPKKPMALPQINWSGLAAGVARENCNWKISAAEQLGDLIGRMASQSAQPERE